ncbi:MAG: fibronectin type III domain-containing protein [Candidatus Eisenbacteria bacterium]|nr:fibronectin type III domain-containing protein [Candidatus Eisenbacteria bacterium]
MRKGYPGATRLLPLVLLLAAACDNGVDPVDLNRTPSKPKSVAVTNQPNSATLEWDFLDEVSTSLSFSGYKIYTLREDEAPPYEYWTQFHTKSGSTSYLPLVKRENSLVGDRMKIEVVGLRNGYLYSFYVVGVQNGKEGPPSDTLSVVPYDLDVDIVIDGESRDLPSYFEPGMDRAAYHFTEVDRIGYDHDYETGVDALTFKSILKGGHLRLLNAGPDAAGTSVPTDQTGMPIGFHTDTQLQRLEFEEGDYIFVWDNNGTSVMSDDHYSRIYIEQVLDYFPQIIIQCAYQPRKNTTNL